MNAILKAQQAYGSAGATLRSPVSLEYDAVARITRQLLAADRTRESDFPGFVTALHRNRRLWSVFATEVADPGNPLPADLRARIFALADFSRRHTSKVLAGTEDITPLVEVNMAILRGLQAQGG